MSDSVQSRILDRLTDVITAIGTGGGGGGDASSAKQDEQTGYLTSISSDSASIVTTLGDTTGNPDPHTTAWYLKHVHAGISDQVISLAAIDGNVSNIKDNVASVLPFIGLDTAAIRAQIPASLGAKTAANSLSVAIASDAIAYGSGNVTAATQRVTLASDGAAVTSLQSIQNNVDRTTAAYRSQASLTRGANTTTYAVNDVMFGVFELTNMAANGGFLLISDIRFMMNIAYTPSGLGNLRLFLYSVTPPSAIADNGAFSLPSGDRASLLIPEGISLGTPRLANGGGTLVLSPSIRPTPLVKLTGTSLFGYIVTEGAWVPQANSETATLTVLGVVP